MRKSNQSPFIDKKQISIKIDQIAERAFEIRDKAILMHIFSFIDLTSLNPEDTEGSILQLTEKVNFLNEKYPELPNVSSVCIFPRFIPIVKRSLKVKNVHIVCVAGGFPFPQVSQDIKIAEILKAIEDGADEIDIVFPVGEFLEGNYDKVFEEIKILKEAAGSKIIKVILETGIIKDSELIKKASTIAMNAGADFIKTSTGKFEKGATPEAVWTICESVREFYIKTGKLIGIKPAGGISDINSAIIYYLIVNEILGNEWLRAEHFRYGASKLANLLLGEKYF